MQPNPPPRAQHNPPKMRGVYPVPPAPRRPHPLPPARPFTPRTRGWRLWLVVGGAFLLLCIGICGILTLSVSVMYANGVLPGVSALGLRLEGMNEREAAAALQSAWKQIHVTDGARSFTVDAGTLGLLLDAPATAALAYRQGRGEGNLLKILTSGAQILPVYSIDPALAENGLQALAQQVNSAPVNAGVRQIGRAHV